MVVKKLQSTTRVVSVNGSFPCRVWEGELEDGTPIAMLVPRVAIVSPDYAHKQSEFDKQMNHHIVASDPAIMRWPERVHIDLQ